MLDIIRHTINIKYVTIYVEVMNMQENYLKSLQMIRILDIKTEDEYKKLLKNYLLLLFLLSFLQFIIKLVKCQTQTVFVDFFSFIKFQL